MSVAEKVGRIGGGVVGRSFNLSPPPHLPFSLPSSHVRLAFDDHARAFAEGGVEFLGEPFIGDGLLLAFGFEPAGVDFHFGDVGDLPVAVGQLFKRDLGLDDVPHIGEPQLGSGDVAEDFELVNPILETGGRRPIDDVEHSSRTGRARCEELPGGFGVAVANGLGQRGDDVLRRLIGRPTR